MGFAEPRLRALNPGLVVASVNGYGSTGPVRRPAGVRLHRPGDERLHERHRRAGASRCAPGRRSAIWSPGSTPPSASSAALLARERGTTTGGQRVEAALTNGLISMMAYFSAAYFATGELPERTGNDHPVVYPYGLFHAADGDVAIAP